MKLSSDFAILDIKKGRAGLARWFNARPLIGVCPPKLRVHVIIEGYISHIQSNDDGTSQEFSVVVEKLTADYPKNKTKPGV